MRIDYLRECIRLADMLNFTEAAKASYISQPVLSKHISNIERELGVRLFYRSQNGVRLTAIGEQFIERARSIVAEYDDTLSEVKHMKSGFSQFVNLGFLYGAASDIIPPAVRHFRKNHPNVFLRFRTFELDEIISALDDDIVDICITSSYQAFELQDTKRYCWLPLYRDSLCVIVPKTLPEARKELLTIDDLRGKMLMQCAPPFMVDKESTMLNQVIAVADDIEVQRAYYGIESMLVGLRSNELMSLSFMHISRLLGDEFAFIPLAELQDEVFEIGVVWKKERETDALQELAELFARQATALGLNH